MKSRNWITPHLFSEIQSTIEQLNRLRLNLIKGKINHSLNDWILHNQFLRLGFSQFPPAFIQTGKNTFLAKNGNHNLELPAQKWNVLHCSIIIMKKPHANLINSSKINWQQKRKVFTTANSQTLMKNIFAQYLKIKLKVSFSLNYLNDTFLVDFKTLCWLEEPLICHIWDTILQAIIN